ncbi:zona pellucida sperm-binding protein 3-like [Plectropomus leopardus]|uniref:zona pellucida sperm-binding protein 3-like n=1 Tax=Plectropomus leopardus TaxID=160734 RepID=UPI001C4C5A87|nr:zona pellucida sperm-binding protein 3-like [Plectropomus leopardus]
MMAFFWQGALLLSLAAAVSVYADMKVDCRPDFVTVVWTESRPQADPSLFRLGNCFPTSLTAREAVFSVDFNNCNFRRMVTGDQLIYTNDLTYTSSPDSHILAFTHPVVCAYERPKDWPYLIYDPVFNTYGHGDLVFHIGLMNDDFSGPAESTSFPLGSFIPIMASVAQKTHQPLLLLLEECVAASTPELQPESSIYPIITNKGCLVDSKISRSKFEPRQKSSEIKLSLQAFRFALGEEVFIHCKLVAWDPNGLDNTKKACQYFKDHGWELLDNSAYSNFCDCCDSTCKSRKIRSIASGKHGIAQKAVLGPLTITDVNS